MLFKQSSDCGSSALFPAPTQEQWGKELDKEECVGCGQRHWLEAAHLDCLNSYPIASVGIAFRGKQGGYQSKEVLQSPQQTDSSKIDQNRPHPSTKKILLPKIPVSPKFNIELKSILILISCTKMHTCNNAFAQIPLPGL